MRFFNRNRNKNKNNNDDDDAAIMMTTATGEGAAGEQYKPPQLAAEYNKKAGEGLKIQTGQNNNGNTNNTNANLDSIIDQVSKEGRKNDKYYQMKNKKDVGNNNTSKRGNNTNKESREQPPAPAAEVGPMSPLAQMYNKFEHKITHLGLDDETQYGDGETTTQYDADNNNIHGSFEVKGTKTAALHPIIAEEEGNNEGGNAGNNKPPKHYITTERRNEIASNAVENVFSEITVPVASRSYDDDSAVTGQTTSYDAIENHRSTMTDEGDDSMVDDESTYTSRYDDEDDMSSRSGSYGENRNRNKRNNSGNNKNRRNNSSHNNRRSAAALNNDDIETSTIENDYHLHGDECRDDIDDQESTNTEHFQSPVIHMRSPANHVGGNASGSHYGKSVKSNRTRGSNSHRSSRNNINNNNSGNYNSNSGNYRNDHGDDDENIHNNNDVVKPTESNLGYVPIQDGTGLYHEDDAVQYYIDNETEIIKKKWGILSITLTSIQLLVVMIQLCMCGVAPIDVNPMIGPYPDAFSDWGGKNIYNIVIEYQLYRFFTSSFLHVGVLHLFVNAAVQLETCTSFEKEWGSMRWLIVYIVSSIGSVLMSCIIDPDTISVGSSGALMGMFGAKLSQMVIYNSFNISHKSKHDYMTLSQMTGVFCMFTLVLLFANVSYIDWSGHVGGFITGFVIGMVLFSGRIVYFCTKLWYCIFGFLIIITSLAVGLWYLFIIMKDYIDDELSDTCEYFRTLYVEGYDCQQCLL